MRSLSILISVLIFQAVHGQVQDSFSDGNLDQNPVWTGDTGHFKVNGSKELQLDAPAQDADSYSVLPSEAIGNAVWEAFIRLEFPPSGSNYLELHLTASNPSLDSSHQGYFLRIGDSEDEVALYRHGGNGPIELIESPDGMVEQDPVTLRVKVARQGTGDISLQVDTNGGTNYTQLGSIYDPTFQSSAFFGIRCYYTATRADKFFLDEIQVSGSPYQDSIPPSLDSLRTPEKGKVQLLYDEALQATSLNPSGFHLTPIGGTPDSITLEQQKRRIELHYPQQIPNDSTYTLSVPSLKDTVGNSSPPDQLAFHYLIPAPPQEGAVVINEIMADPSPSQGLPEREYLELHAADTLIQSTKGWRLQVNNDSVPLNERVLRPGDRILLIPPADSSMFQPPEAPLMISPFPTLTNNEGAILLRGGNGELVDSVFYQDTWQTENKESGGWALERIDPASSCRGEANWKSSTASDGGTPGRINQVHDPDFDEEPPRSLQARAINDSTVLMKTEEPLDPNTKLIDKLSIPGAPSLDTLLPKPGNKGSELRIKQSLDTGRWYELRLEPVPDCFGNIPPSSLKSPFVLPYIARAQDVVINELLYDPGTGGSDFIECYNRSKRILEMSDWRAARFEDSLTDKVVIGGKEELLPPGAHRFLSEDLNGITKAYPGTPIDKGIQMAQLPNYPNDSGTAVLLNEEGAILDRFPYRSSMHHPLLQNTEGVSLERTDPEAPTARTDNWYSAAKKADYGTPGERNSQFLKAAREGKGKRLWRNPKVFSPDLDGDRDQLRIHYRFSEPGMNCSLKILDPRGREVKTLADGELFNRKGFYRWDGTRKDGSKAPIGIYVILLECIHPDGKRFIEKSTCVVGKRWNER
ncbi:MAG: lamin tail domain-containing protein [Flavobacteriales bacterium]